MLLLDGALGHAAVLELSAHRHIPSFYRGACRNDSLCCYAKISVDDDEQKHKTSRKGFSLRVPTIPKLGDIESARRMLESAFQGLSFEMPRIPIDSALQGLSFSIFKLSIPKQALVFDITGFVATKLKKPPKDVGNVTVLDEALYPRCAWPRTLKEAHVEEVFSTKSIENMQDQETSVNLVSDETRPAYPQLHTMYESSKADLSNKMELGGRPSVPSTTGYGFFKAPVGPHCAWPRKTHQFVNVEQALSPQNTSTSALYPRSAWPRKTASYNGVIVGSEQSIVESSMRSVAEREEASPCIIEGGARCAWPRKILPAKGSCHGEETTVTLSEDVHNKGSKRGKDASVGEISSADLPGAAELPRRMLATSVGLSVLNQLVKGSIATSLFDFCSLLPAGYLEIAEEEDAALDLGRRTLLVFIKHSSG